MAYKQVLCQRNEGKEAQGELDMLPLDVFELRLAALLDKHLGTCCAASGLQVRIERLVGLIH